MTERLLYICMCCVVCAFACGGGASTPTGPESTETTPTAPATAVTWGFNGSNWQPSATAPACPSPLVFAAPTDLSRATAVLYPGQIRGGDYKAHGGLRFADGTNTAIQVVAPMAGYLYRGARYIEGGETQYLFDIINSCGVMHRFDHLLTLSARFQAIADTFPPAGASSATTSIAAGQIVAEGEVIATAVGSVRTGNTAFDWGAYDLRQRNAASTDPAWFAAHSGEQAPYALCWLDYLPAGAGATLRALPGGDGVLGKSSDYCR